MDRSVVLIVLAICAPLTFVFGIVGMVHHFLMQWRFKPGESLHFAFRGCALFFPSRLTESGQRSRRVYIRCMVGMLICFASMILTAWATGRH